MARDTENSPEIKNLKAVDYAFLPMNLPVFLTTLPAPRDTIP